MTCKADEFPRAALDAMIGYAARPVHDDGHTDCYYAGMLDAALAAMSVQWDDDNGHNSHRRLIGPWLPKPASTPEAEYARNQREAIERVRSLPDSERSAVALRPSGQSAQSEGSGDAR